jgi:peptidoglycan/xylan/chitin deacetylase (PgdA/CDA1 family)
VLVLGLHRVLSDKQQPHANSLPGMVLREATFVALLGFIQRCFQVISLDTFLDGEAAGRRLSKPRCLLTFDDGWRDNYTTAHPWLRKFGLPAVLFVVTGAVGSQQGFWVEQLRQRWQEASWRERLLSQIGRSVLTKALTADLEGIVDYLKHLPAQERQQVLSGLLSEEGAPQPPSDGDGMVTWQEIESMAQAGISFQAHTVSHPLLTYEEETTIEQELRLPKEMLEQKLGKKVPAFAYPNGDWDARVRKMVQAAGYDCAFTVRPGWHRDGDDRFTIPRIMLHEGKVTGPGGRFSPAMLGLSLTGWR